MYTGNTVSRKPAASSQVPEHHENIASNKVFPTKVHGITSQKMIFTQNINRDTVYKDTERQKQKRRSSINANFGALAQFVRPTQTRTVHRGRPGSPRFQNEPGFYAASERLSMHESCCYTYRTIRSVTLVFKS